MPIVNINKERVINAIAVRFDTAAAGLNDCADNYQRMEIIQAQVSICRLIAGDLSLAGNVSRRVETIRKERETAEARVREERQRVREAERQARQDRFDAAEREAATFDVIQPIETDGTFINRSYSPDFDELTSDSPTSP